MKKKLCILGVVLGLMAAPLLPRPVRADESLIDQLAWLTGRWISEDGGQYIEETWSPARGDAMVGALRWARNGSVWLYELMSIEEEEDGLVFRLRHFDRNLAPWKSEADGPLTYPLQNFGENMVIFENPDRDQPRRFVYERKGDSLTIRLEGPEGDDPSPFRFRLDS